MTMIDEDRSVPPLIAAPQTFVVDPVYADVVETGREPVPTAAPTAGPNRYTMHVPTEATVVSLGAASGRWNTDKGITGYTHSHIHFETKMGPRTVVSLGAPATRASLTGLRGAAPRSTHGYSMVTEKNAWLDAQKQHYFLSRAEDITLRTMGEGKRAVVQSDGGMVDVVGGKGVNVVGGGVAIGAEPELPFEDIKYEQPWGGETPHSVAAKAGEVITTIANGLMTSVSLIAGLAKFHTEHKHGHLHASIDTFSDVAEWGADAVELYRTVGELRELFSKEEAVEGKLKMEAAKNFAVSANGSAGFFGVKGASLGSSVWSSVSAVVSASLKGSLFAGVAAAYTSLKGYKKIELGSDHGKAELVAHKSVEVSAGKSFIAAGKELAQVSGEEGAYFAGGQRVWLGTTAGGGWGLELAADGIKLGKASSANSMKAAKVDTNRAITFDKTGLRFKSGDTLMAYTADGVATKAGEVKFSASNGDLRVGAAKVLIDA
jgi:hypothetical protein